MKTTPWPLGQRLRDARKALDMTQTQLAAAIGCSQAMISRLEVGLRTNPAAFTIRDIELALGLAPYALLEGMGAHHV